MLSVTLFTLRCSSYCIRKWVFKLNIISKIYTDWAQLTSVWSYLIILQRLLISFFLPLLLFFVSVVTYNFSESHREISPGPQLVERKSSRGHTSSLRLSWARTAGHKLGAKQWALKRCSRAGLLSFFRYQANALVY